MGTGVGQVFALQVNGSSSKRLGHSPGEVQRRGTADVVLEQRREQREDDREPGDVQEHDQEHREEVADAKAIRLDGLSLRRMMASNSEMGYAIMTRLAAALGERLTNLRVQFVSLT